MSKRGQNEGSIFKEKERPRTPAEVAKTLVNEIEQFEIDVHIAKRTTALYPKLFTPAAAEGAS
jgi:hypothetical protein